MVERPSTMMGTPNQRTTGPPLARNTDPSSWATTPSTVNTTVNPATKSRAAFRVTIRAWRSPSSETGSAET